MIQPPDDPYEYEEEAWLLGWLFVGIVVIGSLYWAYNYFF